MILPGKGADEVVIRTIDHRGTLKANAPERKCDVDIQGAGVVVTGHRVYFIPMHRVYLIEDSAPRATGIPVRLVENLRAHDDAL